MSASSPQFEVFRPLRADDFCPQPSDPFFDTLVERVRETAHTTYVQIEAAALPPPPDATVQTETAALIGSLSFADAHYTSMGQRYQMNVSSRFTVPFASEEEWGSTEPETPDIQPNIIFTTSVTATTGTIQDSELFAAALADSYAHRGVNEGKIESHKQLMSVSGEPVYRRTLGFKRTMGYTYTPEQRAEVRSGIGERLVQDGSLQVDTARVSVETPIGLWLMHNTGAVEYQPKRSAPGADTPETTPPELIVPTLRILRTLVSMGSEQPRSAR